MDVDGGRSIFNRLGPSSSNGSMNSSKQQKVCFNWEKGNCTRNPCPFLHGELPTAANGKRGYQGFGAEDNYRGGGGGRGGGGLRRSGNYNFSNNNTWGRGPAQQPVSGNRTFVRKVEKKICNYWVQGSCRFGDGCKFLHQWSTDCFSLLTTLEGHQKAVTGITLPSGSDKLYSGCEDEMVKIWDCQSGQLAGTVNLGCPVGCMISEGPWIFVGLTNLVKAWNIQTSMELPLSGPVGQVYSLVVGNDLLFAGSKDGSILAWKFNAVTNTFEPAASLKGHTFAVVTLVVGGNRLYSGSMDHTIRVWSRETLQCMQTLTGHSNVVTSVLCWDQFLLSASLDNTVKVWATSEAGSLEVSYTHQEEHGVITLCGMHDTESKPVLLCSCNDNSVRVYDLPSFSERGKIFSKEEVRRWQLLLKKMLRSDEKFPKQAERKGKLVLMKHTGGLPLAIKEAAMEWAEKRRQGIEWEAIVDSDVLELRASLEDLDLSFYYTLEPDEKAIFLHLGFFKLGENIRPQKFEHTFAASVPNSSVSDAHRPYVMSVDYLHHMKTIEFKDKDISVIPIYHKLSIGKAKKGNDGAHIGIIYCNRERFKGSTDQNEEELICVSFKGGSCLDHVSLSYWESFEQLRVLDFEGFGLRFLPESVSELMELRYLGLRNNHIKELPHWLSNLKKLEVLDISLNFMVKVPDIIWEMDALVHLYMSDISCSKPLKIQALKNLETLTYISVDNWAYEVSGLQMMINLRKLKIEVDGNSDVSMLFASLADLKSLKCLVLQGFRFRSMPSLHGISVLQHLTQLKLVGCIPKLPNFHQNLRKLTLINSCLDEDPMPILEKLSRLWYLKMRNSYTGQQMVISKNGFPDLSEMFIEELWHLRNIRVEHVVLKLYRLEIRQCPYLHSLPKEMIVESTRF